MGILRFLFATSVFLVHSSPYNLLIGGQLAVQSFYMFSGFLISYILIESKSYTSIKNFYFNRILRIYPIYFIILILTIISYLFSFNFLENEKNDLISFFDNNNFKINFILIITNIFIFFQDYLFFLGVENNQFYIAENFLNSEVVLSKGLIIPQSWTLSLELFFYLLAPFILKKIRLIFLIIIFSLLLRFFLVTKGFSSDPWSYRFFPNEISLFLFGSLSHQLIYPKIKILFSKNRYLPRNITLFLILLVFIFPIVELSFFIKSTSFLFFLFFLMPFTFIFQNQNKVDRIIGELSYPIYIFHISLISLTSYIVDYLLISFSVTILSFSFTLLMSIIINIIISKPINKIRIKYKRI